MSIPDRSKEKVSKKRKSVLTKTAVKFLIKHKNWNAEYRYKGDDKIHAYEGCVNNLLMILDDCETSVQEAEPSNPDYKNGFRTIIMDVPYFSATVL